MKHHSHLLYDSIKFLVLVCWFSDDFSSSGLINIHRKRNNFTHKMYAPMACHMKLLCQMLHIGRGGFLPTSSNMADIYCVSVVFVWSHLQNMSRCMNTIYATSHSWWHQVYPNLILLTIVWTKSHSWPCARCSSLNDDLVNFCVRRI